MLFLCNYHKMLPFKKITVLIDSFSLMFKFKIKRKRKKEKKNNNSCMQRKKNLKRLKFILTYLWKIYEFYVHLND